MMQWLDVYLDEMVSSEEMNKLIYNFFEKVKPSKHYMRNSVNDFLLEMIVRSVSFKLVGIPKKKIMQRIDERFLKEIKKSMLDMICDKLIIDEPPPEKLPPVIKKKVPKSETSSTPRNRRHPNKK